MGRRKIEIKAIKDDRNRSVTFLKRKGGLFKKAHELAVLCSVDVAVIIFGHNKKLYQFSSGDINETLGRAQYYGPPHEHKGPNDYFEKRDADDDDDDDVSSRPDDDLPPQSHDVGPMQMQPQQAFQHVNQASVSPPLPNGLAYQGRHPTPQPTGMSRPSSRNNVQRMNSGVAPAHHQRPTPPPAPQQNGFAYMPNPPIYNPHVNSGLPQQPQQQQHPPPPSQPQPQPQPQTQPRPITYVYSQQPSVTHHSHAGPSITQQQHPLSHQQVLPEHLRQQQAQSHHSFAPTLRPYIQEQPRRQSMPPAFPQNDRPGQGPEPPSQQHLEVKHEQNNPSPPQPRPLPSKSRSIFTPIDDRGSVLARQFQLGPLADSPSTESPSKPDNEKAEPASHSMQSMPPRPPPAVHHPSRPVNTQQRTQSFSAVPPRIPPITRTDSLPTGLQRPRLKVQIPSENSEAGSTTEDSSPRVTAGGTSHATAKGSSPHSAVVLPPPSPSASALLSAGATGPPNPFARPPPPGAGGPQNGGGSFGSNNIDTPNSALPSRFVSDILLPSPSSFYPEWGFGRSGVDSNMLPSPLTFPTPMLPNGPNFPKEPDDAEKKRKAAEGSGTHGPETSGAKKIRVE